MGPDFYVVSRFDYRPTSNPDVGNMDYLQSILLILFIDTDFVRRFTQYTRLHRQETGWLAIITMRSHIIANLNL